MADIAAQVDNASRWRENRDEIVRAFITEHAAHGASLDFLAVQRALAAAFATAAAQRATVFGCDSAWAVLSRHHSMMEAP